MSQRVIFRIYLYGTIFYAMLVAFFMLFPDVYSSSGNFDIALNCIFKVLPILFLQYASIFVFYRVLLKHCGATPLEILIARKNYCYMIVTGLFFSLLGDICVQIPHDGHESYLYKFGLGFFALSNVFYIWAFNSRSGSTFYFKFLLSTVTYLYTFLILLHFGFLSSDCSVPVNFQAPMILYSFLVSTTLWSALDLLMCSDKADESFSFCLSKIQRYSLLLGIIFFFTSDLSLALYHFNSSRESPFLLIASVLHIPRVRAMSETFQKIFTTITYYLGQYGIVRSIV